MLCLFIFGLIVDTCTFIPVAAGGLQLLGGGVWVGLYLIYCSDAESAPLVND